MYLNVLKKIHYLVKLCGSCPEISYLNVFKNEKFDLPIDKS